MGWGESLMTFLTPGVQLSMEKDNQYVDSFKENIPTRPEPWNVKGVWRMGGQLEVPVGSTREVWKQRYGWSGD